MSEPISQFHFGRELFSYDNGARCRKLPAITRGAQGAGPILQRNSDWPQPYILRAEIFKAQGKARGRVRIT